MKYDALRKYKKRGVKFSPANKKLRKLRARLGGKVRIYSFDLLAGWSCPFAHDCKSWVTETGSTRTIHDGVGQRFRCYAASQEAVYKNTFAMRASNFINLYDAHGVSEMVHLLEEAFPTNADVIRIHTSGDFFSRDYFQAWYIVARNHPGVRFYCYTKATPFLIGLRLPDNFRLTVSDGGTRSDLQLDLTCPVSYVVNTPEEAKTKGLAVSDDDYHAYEGRESFALVLHGVQPAGHKGV